MKTIKIGQFGFGCVGEGLYDIITNQKNDHIQYQKICISNLDKKRKAPESLLTDNKEEIFNDQSINLIVELINDADIAFDLVARAIKNGIPVVSANKKMIAVYYQELQQLIEEYHTPFVYEGAVCGAIPILRTLEEYYQYDAINHIEGIFNGTTNYILTKQYEKELTFDVALEDAKALGFAETDPTSDIDGFDPKYKLKILLAHAFGIDVPVDKITNFGIRNILKQDIQYARNKGLKYKLLAKIIRNEDQICAFVAPLLVKENDLAYKIDNENNYVLINTEYTGNQLLYGKGAGSHPTGMAVFSDILGLQKGYHYAEKTSSNRKFTNDILVEVIISSEKHESLSSLNFEESYQVYESKGYHYRTGKINLSSLHKEEFPKDFFIGLISPNVEFKQNTELVLG